MFDESVKEVFDGETAWFVEFDKHPSKVLSHHWPDIPNYGDITAIDWDTVEPIDILIGGSPCQDVSMSGSRKGFSEGTRSNLWVNMREAVAHLQPKLVIWENVRGAHSAKAQSESDLEREDGQMGEWGGNIRALGRVLGDFSSLGYNAQWTTLYASEIGAPHRRDRVFVLAWRDSESYSEYKQLAKEALTRQVKQEVSDSESRRWELGGLPLGVEEGWPSSSSCNCSLSGTCEESETSGNTECSRWTGAARERVQHEQYVRGDSHNLDVEWGAFDSAVKHWEEVFGESAPYPVRSLEKLSDRLNPEFPQWMMGIPKDHITGVPDIPRSAQIKMSGNSVVPQQSTMAIRLMLDSLD